MRDEIIECRMDYMREELEDMDDDDLLGDEAVFAAREAEIQKRLVALEE
jgi:hypothetical protein